MTGRRREADADVNDPLRTMHAERVERDDGRYLIYFSWDDPEPDGTGEAAARLSAPSAEDPAPTGRSTIAGR